MQIQKLAPNKYECETGALLLLTWILMLEHG